MDGRGERLPGLPVQVGEEEPGHGVLAGGDGILAGEAGILTLVGHHREHLVGEIPGGHGAEGDAALVRHHRLRQRGRILLVDDPGAVFALHHGLLGEGGPGGRTFGAGIGVDGHLGPLAPEPEIAPHHRRSLGPAVPGLGVDGVQLLHGDRGQGVALVHEDDVGVEAHGDAHGHVAELGLEGLGLLRRELPRGEDQQAAAIGEVFDGISGQLRPEHQVGLGVDAPEGRAPLLAQVRQLIGRGDVDGTFHRAGGLVLGNGRGHLGPLLGRLSLEPPTQAQGGDQGQTRSEACDVLAHGTFSEEVA